MDLNPSARIEAILFVAEKPVSLQELAQVMEMPVPGVEEALSALETRLLDGALCLREVGGGWRLATRPEAYPYVERFATSTAAPRLSQAGLETLAVIAYRQPISRGQVSEVRGVDADSAVSTLESRGLIKEVRRLPGPGSPVLWGTTDLFLEKLGLRNLDDLPPLADHVPPASVVESLEETFRP